MNSVSGIEFAGRVIIIGCGSIGQGVLPLIRRHIPLEGERRLLVLSADEEGRGLARACGARFEHSHLTPANHRRILGRHAKAGDLVLNLSVNVSSLDLVRFCAEQGILYVDTSIEPWPGVYANPMLTMRDRTNFVIREKALRLAAELGPDAPTAIVDHGANPGLVSHFVKRALRDLDRILRKGDARPASQEDWAALARDLDVRVIQIAERDTQVSDHAKRHGEFVNTWSIDGFVDELMQPSEVSIAADSSADMARMRRRAGSDSCADETRDTSASAPDSAAPNRNLNKADPRGKPLRAPTISPEKGTFTFTGRMLSRRVLLLRYSLPAGTARHSGSGCRSRPTPR